MAAAEFGNRADYFLLYRAPDRRAAPSKQRQHPRLSKFLATRVRGFRHAVREKDHTIARRKPHATELIALLSKNAENSAAVPQALVCAVRVHDKGCIVAGVGVAQKPGGTIQLRIERSEERRVGKEGRSRWSPY